MNMENTTKLESAPKKPHIRLEFFRHDEKDTPTTSGPRPNDNLVRLTQTGRIQATEAGKSKNPHPEVAISYGSSRQRSQETALRHMYANDDTITPEMSLEDLRARIEKDMEVGKKDLTTSKLDFNWDGTKEYHDIGYKHYLETKDALIFLWKESDQLVKELKDQQSESYSRCAGKVAELVEKYLKILPRWQQIVNEDPKKYEKYNNELQRFFGSHQTVLEPFLMKVIEKSEGEESLKNFIDTIPDKNGFGLSEGFSITIEDSESGEPNLKVKFKDKEWIIDNMILKKIIEERDDLNKQITDSQ